MDPERLVGFDSEYCRCGCGYYLACFIYPNGTSIVLEDRDETVRECEHLRTKGFTVAGHNIRSDFTALGTYPEDVPVFDSLVLSWLFNENGRHGLKYLAERDLGRKLEDPIKTRDKKVYWRTYKTHIIDAPQEEVATYCMEDARATRDLSLFYWERLPEGLTTWYLNKEAPFDYTLYKMERRGIALDGEALMSETYTLSQDVEVAKAKVFASVGYEFNLNSPQQLGNVLYTGEWHDKERQLVGQYKNGKDKYGWVNVPRKGLGLRPGKTTENGLPSTDEETLLGLAGHPTVDAVLEYREAAKVLSTYLLAFPQYMEGGRLFGHFNSTGTVTGRLSSNDPNLQNIPSRGSLGKRVRTLFVPEPGNVLVVADLDQVEYRLLASFSREPALVEAFETGADIHLRTAELVGVGQRAVGKTLNYAVVYGAGPGKVASLLTQAGLPTSPDQARNFLDRYYDALPNVVAWKERVLAYCRRNGFVVTLGGRLRRLPDINLPVASQEFRRRRFGAERQAINSVIQGSAADLMKVAMLRMDEDGLPILLQVHDEVVAEVPDDAQSCAWAEEVILHGVAAAREELGVAVPLTCEPKAVQNWGQAK